MHSYEQNPDRLWYSVCSKRPYPCNEFLGFLVLTILKKPKRRRSKTNMKMITRPSALLIYAVNPSYLEMKFIFSWIMLRIIVLFHGNVEELKTGTSEKLEAQPSAFHTSRVFFKIPMLFFSCLTYINSDLLLSLPSFSIDLHSLQVFWLIAFWHR